MSMWSLSTTQVIFSFLLSSKGSMPSRFLITSHVFYIVFVQHSLASLWCPMVLPTPALVGNLNFIQSIEVILDNKFRIGLPKTMLQADGALSTKILTIFVGLYGKDPNDTGSVILPMASTTSLLNHMSGLLIGVIWVLSMLSW